MRSMNQEGRSATSRTRHLVHQLPRRSPHPPGCPYRLAKETAKAWKDEMCLTSPDWLFLLLESPKRRTISPIMRNCTKRPLNVNQIAHPKSKMIRTYDHKMSLMTLIHPFNISILFFVFESFANIRISVYLSAFFLKDSIVCAVRCSVVLPRCAGTLLRHRWAFPHAAETLVLPKSFLPI